MILAAPSESQCKKTGSGTVEHTKLFLKEDSDTKGLLPISCTKEKISRQVKWSVKSQGCRALLQLSESDSPH